jgi:hypothetical protein
MIPFYLLALSWTTSTPVLTHPTTVVGHWTINGLTRICSPADQQCKYSFGLDEHTGRANMANCRLTVAGNPESDFPSMHCDERFLVQGGWNVTGGPDDHFITVVVTDLSMPAYAFFSFREKDFNENGVAESSMTRPAYTVGDFGPGPAESAEQWDESDSDGDDGDDDDDSDDESLVKRQDGDLGKMQISQLRRCEYHPPLDVFCDGQG